MSALNSAYVNEESHAFASRGMRVQGVAHIDANTVLHRFVLRADVPDKEYLASPWWFQPSAVRKILEAARSGHRGDFSVAGQAAKAAGLSTTWKNEKDPPARQSGSHYLLTVKVFAPLEVFWGAPRAVGKNKSEEEKAGGLQSGDGVAEVEVVPDPRCVQYFIPGMHEISHKAATVISKTKFKHSSELADGEVELFLRNVSSKS